MHVNEDDGFPQQGYFRAKRSQVKRKKCAESLVSQLLGESHQTIDLTVWRDEEEIPVECSITRFYKGSNDTDDPQEVHVSETATTADGKTIILTPDEMEDAAIKWISFDPGYDPSDDPRED